MADERRLRRCIKKVVFEDFRGFNMPLFSVTIKAGGKVRRSPIFKVQPESIQPWPIDLDISDLDASAVIEFKLYGRKARWPHKKLLGYEEKVVSEIFSRNWSSGVTVSLLSHASPVSEICTFKLFPPDDLRQAGADAVKDNTKPKTPLEKTVKLLDALPSIKDMIDVMSEDHPSARIAWSFLSIGADILKKQGETDDIFVNLYKDILSAYDQAGRDEVLQKRDQLQPIYDALFTQTIECFYFIKGYANRDVTRSVPSPRLLDKAKEFQDGLTCLRDKLQSGIATETAIVTLGIQQRVDDMIRVNLLQAIRPPTELSHKSTCMKGTRVQTINYFMSWIAACSGGTLWCDGLAGTGKSSLAGTLYEHLSVYASERNRLGAFVRYDRIECPDASRLVLSIAYSLGTIDNRIGTAIAEVIVKNKAVLSTAASSASQQFRLLIQDPLESLTEIADEGPLVVIIDGMDECSPSPEVLAVLSGGFGPRLPFMRLLVFSRPTEVISRAFTAPNSAVTRFALDADSEEVNHDIKYFITYRFSDIFSNLSARSEPNDLQEMWKVLNAADGLSKRADGLFIWAATACRFIRESPSTSRLLALFRVATPASTVGALNDLYRTILEVILLESEKEVAKSSIRAVLGAMMVQGAPEGMTAKALDTLVFLPERPQAHRVLSKLGSVIHESIGYYQFFHTTFYDFLQDQSQCGAGWYIDIEEHKGQLHQRRLEVLKKMRAGSSGDLSSLL